MHLVSAILNQIKNILFWPHFAFLKKYVMHAEMGHLQMSLTNHNSSIDQEQIFYLTFLYVVVDNHPLSFGITYTHNFYKL